MDADDALIDDFGLLRKAAHEYFSHCNGEMGKRPHILLALLVTSSQHRGKGAGSLLVQWGIAMSDKSGLPAYLQASEAGRRLYRHHGFAELSKVEFNLTGYGLNGIEVMTEMLRYPSTSATHADIANQILTS
ncbi:hypothetical protein LTR97_000318 [Elasticomyces elasticus]|uniref:N-acetyltransferase domain-containing protein n=1 Tax=Elasticomyces elasticus TaxID=574655 RepID=A0AAN8A5F3_9PEZI|nr:hypothetical protein LTR97_000318 [Elasticomyces elasticus]